MTSNLDRGLGRAESILVILDLMALVEKIQRTNIMPNRPRVTNPVQSPRGLASTLGACERCSRLGSTGSIILSILDLLTSKGEKSVYTSPET